MSSSSYRAFSPGPESPQWLLEKLQEPNFFKLLKERCIVGFTASNDPRLGGRALRPTIANNGFVGAKRKRMALVACDDIKRASASEDAQASGNLLMIAAYPLILWEFLPLWTERQQSQLAARPVELVVGGPNG
jgi:hypothetical protein